MKSHTIIQHATYLILILVFVVNTNAQVRSDYDKNVDFTKYKTCKFIGWENDSDKQLNEFDKKRIIDAFKSELKARGFTVDENNADVGITLFIVVDEKTSRTAYTNYHGGMGYGRRAWGWGAGMGSSTTTYSEQDYKQGTVVISFYDEEEKNLVFQGTLQTVVKEKPEKREKSIPKNVAKLMKKYPVKPIK